VKARPEDLLKRPKDPLICSLTLRRILFLLLAVAVAAGIAIRLRRERVRGPTPDDLTQTLMQFDANHNGQIERDELPERMQAMFDRGDLDHNGVLSRDEIAKLAEAAQFQPRRRRD
jgi:Ca2+-binding EF-hand superfamily protein